MAPPHSNDAWFVESESKRSGPYDLEKIQDLMLQGKCRPNDRVIPQDAPEQWLTVREAVDAFLRRTATGTIHLPPRPLTLPSEGPTASKSPQGPANDPILGLFDVLQHARSRAAPKSAISGVQRPPEPRKIPTQLILIVGLSVVLLVSVGVVIKMLQNSGSAVDAKTAAPPKSTEMIKTQSPPARPISPPISPPAAAKRPNSQFAPNTSVTTFERERDDRDTRDEPARDREREDDWRARDEHGEPIVTDRQPPVHSAETPHAEPTTPVQP